MKNDTRLLSGLQENGYCFSGSYCSPKKEMGIDIWDAVLFLHPNGVL